MPEGTEGGTDTGWLRVVPEEEGARLRDKLRYVIEASRKWSTKGAELPQQSINTCSFSSSRYLNPQFQLPFGLYFQYPSSISWSRLL
ncbi:UNVERIFIED_CONTAM: hypothetical protein FKN15_057185 [Acipenser sinensis]